MIWLWLALACAPQQASQQAAVPPLICPSGSSLQGNPDGPGWSWCATPDGLPHGLWRSRNEDGSRAFEGVYVYGARFGPFWAWRPDGGVAQSASLDAQGDGNVVRFGPDGAELGKLTVHAWQLDDLTQRSSYPNGSPESVRHGLAAPDGSFLAHGLFEAWYPDGTRLLDGSSLMGTRSGAWVHFDKAGAPDVSWPVPPPARATPAWPRVQVGAHYRSTRTRHSNDGRDLYTWLRLDASGATSDESPARWAMSEPGLASPAGSPDSATGSWQLDGDAITLTLRFANGAQIRQFGHVDSGGVIFDHATALNDIDGPRKPLERFTVRYQVAP